MSKGNYSGDTFNKLRHYVSVRLQQGVPILDTDWNEMDDIRRFELQAFLKWFVGNGVPKGDNGFSIRQLASSDPIDNFKILSGRCLVDGLEATNEEDISYSDQELVKNPGLADELGVPHVPQIEKSSKRTDLVYLDVWEREVDGSELINSKVGIPTCLRIKREWVVRIEKNHIKATLDGISLLDNLPTHTFYPLAQMQWEDNKIVLIRDLRRTGINISDLTAEIVEARGTKGNIGNRLDVSLTARGELRQHVVGDEQIVETSKLAELISGRDGSEYHYHRNLKPLPEERTFRLPLVPLHAHDVSGQDFRSVNGVLVADEGKAAKCFICVVCPYPLQVSKIKVEVDVNRPNCPFKLKVRIWEQWIPNQRKPPLLSPTKVIDIDDANNNKDVECQILLHPDFSPMVLLHLFEDCNSSLSIDNVFFLYTLGSLY